MSEEKKESNKENRIKEELKPNGVAVIFGRVLSVCCVIEAVVNVGMAIHAIASNNSSASSRLNNLTGEDYNFSYVSSSDSHNAAAFIINAVKAGIIGVGATLLTNAADRPVKFIEKLDNARHLTEASQAFNAL